MGRLVLHGVGTQENVFDLDIPVSRRMKFSTVTS